MNTIKVKRGHLKGCLTRAETFAKSINESVSNELLEIHLKRLEYSWSEFVSLQDQLLAFVTEDKLDSEDDFAEYESKYLVAQSTITKCIRERERREAPVVNESAIDKLADQQSSFLKLLGSSKHSSSGSISLPKINIPLFGGDYKQWPSFRDLFVGSIDENSSLSPTQKFHYLTSCLRDEAAALIRHISISDANYTDAWERLEQRYDRSNLIIQSHIQSFLSMPTMNSMNVQVLRKLSDSADETIRGLNALKSISRDPWVIFILLQKLDQDTRQAWAEETGSRDNCTVDEFLTFLRDRCNALEACQALARPIHSRNKPKAIQTHLVETTVSCPNCKLDHTLSKCPKFVSLDITVRRSFVKENSLCFNCLRSGHSASRCRSNFKCRVCHSRHHTLVHQQTTSHDSSIATSSNSSTEASSSNSSPASTSTVTLCSSIVANSTSFESSCSIRTILPTAIAHTHDRYGVLQKIRLLLDSGSQVSFITEDTVQRLGLVRKSARIPVVGVGSTSAGVTNGIVTLKLYSRLLEEFVEVSCYVVSKLTSLVPASVSTSIDSSLLSLSLADPTFNVPGHIDILIGADKVFSVFKGAPVRHQQKGPDLIPTVFGLVVCGRLDESSVEHSAKSFCTYLDTSNTFDLERFWRLEEIQQAPSLSTDDKRAEDLFLQTHSRLPDGRYIVELPFKRDEKEDFRGSFSVAFKRFLSLERKMAADPNLKKQYVDFMKEYQSLGHMEEIPESEINLSSADCYYLPHHAVFKADSSTTKIRVVFDASARSDGNISLNDSLLIGHSHQRDLFSICIAFRRHLYTISGDIEKMFRQIKVAPKHTNYQRILWRESSDQPLKHYRLLTVTYGTACAPFLAVRTLYQLAQDSIDTYPRASSVLINDFYIDDVMTGSDSVEEITSLRSELVSLLSSGGFNLRKWTTNCWPLLLSLPENQRELSPREFEEYASVKLLGLQWFPAKDTFSYKVNLSHSSQITKRHILSESSKIFDPIGFITPVVISVKILFQELWRKKYKWDEPVSLDLSNQWQSIREELPNLECLDIPRILWKSRNTLELIGFCDASLDAYAAVVYCRSLDSAGNVYSTIVAAKSRVAPIKVVSLPRLELCGAVLLCRLVSKLKESLQMKDLQVTAFTDSTIVLHWLSALPKRWSVFISNRTAEILSVLPRDSWYHVRSHHNPADCASRGIPPAHLLKNELWWSGPSWIKDERSTWPTSNVTSSDIPADVNLEERKGKSAKVLVTNVNPQDIHEIIINNCAHYVQSIRVLAYVFRFISNARAPRGSRQGHPLSTGELSKAKLKLIRYYQEIDYASEIEAISCGKVLKKGSILATLTPFLDGDKVLRVGGRIQESHANYSTKHPIILGKNTRFAKLIAEHVHKKHLHASVSLMFAILRQEYYIVGVRNLLRKVVHECVSCFRHRRLTAEQLMSDLPSQRVQFARPFSKVGVDYAGPITLRLARGRNPKFVKGYIALFVCFTTKAIHIELVGDLSTAAFLAALDRFAARRGKPMEIWSDNASNFHGAKRCLNEMYQALMNQKHSDAVVDHLSKDGVSWHFIPPAAPHFGGLWEAGVKSVKYHLKRVIKDHRLTYEEMYTLLTQVEAVLNSRPMWPTSDMDPMALSPAHFLIGEPLFCVPRPDMCKTFDSPYINWSLLQTLKQGFWKRWHAEYLTSLQQRAKWHQEKLPLKVDDVVLLKDSNLPPTKWILARIKSLHPGRDNRNRVATIVTQTGEYTRPIIKLVPLPITGRPESSRGG